MYSSIVSRTVSPNSSRRSSQVPLRSVYGAYWMKHDMMFARRREGRVERGRDAHVDVRSVRIVSVLRVVVRFLDVIHAGAEGDCPLKVDPVPREAREARGFLERQVDLARRSLDLEVLDPSDEIRGKVGLVNHLEECPLRVGPRCNHLRVHLLARRQLHADRASVAGEDVPDLGIHSDFRTEATSRAGDRLADHPHPTADVAPGTVRAV